MSTAEQQSSAPAPGTVAEMMAELARIKAENESLKKQVPNPAKERHVLGEGLSCRIGEKGGISIYGLNRKFPVTLYKEQFEKLVKAIPALQAFVSANTDKLTVKPAIVK